MSEKELEELLEEELGGEWWWGLDREEIEERILKFVKQVIKIQSSKESAKI